MEQLSQPQSWQGGLRPGQAGVLALSARLQAQHRAPAMFPPSEELARDVRRRNEEAVVHTASTDTCINGSASRARATQLAADMVQLPGARPHAAFS